jgi:HEAT repeat protein/pimeloyl-ACP methyl ester carboxylesterase
MINRATGRVVGGLRILPPEPTQAATLLVVVHGWGGNTGTTWGRTPELLLEQSPRAVDVGLFSYESGLWWLGRKGLEDLASQLLQDILDAADQYGYRQVGIAGHSLGGLVAVLAAEMLLDRERLALTALLCVGTPWNGVWAAGLAPPFIRQLRDLAPGSRPVREAARRAFERVSGFAWTEDAHGRRDPLADPLPGGAARRYWTYLGHRGACAARDESDERFRSFQRFAERASGASTLLYLRALRNDLENWRIRPISSASAEELYERQSASPWKATGADDPERPSPEEKEALAEPRPRQDDLAGSDRLDNVLGLLDSDQPCVCLTGEGGAGKTTSITELGRLAAERALQAPRRARIPVVLRLNADPVDPPAERSVRGTLGSFGRQLQAAADVQHWCRDQAEEDLRRRLVLLVDGLDEAHRTQVSLVRELSLRVSRAQGRVVVAGRPESVTEDREFRVFRLDALDRPRVEGAARRQLGDAGAKEFWEWIPAGFQGFLTNPGQLEMTMRLWHGGGYAETPPATLGELYERSLPYCLGRTRQPTTPPDEDKQRWHGCAGRAKASLAVPAFEEMSALTSGCAPPRLDLGGLSLTDEDCRLLETAGILEERAAEDGTTARRFASARWREFFASLELRRRAEGSEPLGEVGRPSWLNVWRMAAARGSDAVVRAAAAFSPMLETVVAVSGGASDVGKLVKGMGSRQRQLMVNILRETPGRAALAALVHLCKDPVGGVRSAAAAALGGTTDPAALAALVHLCQDPVRGVRWAAAEALKGTTDPAAIGALLRMCEDRESDVRVAAGALEGTTDLVAIAALLRMCGDQDSDVRVAAAGALRATADPAVLATLLRLCEDPESDVRWVAAGELKGTTEPAVLVALARLCEDREGRVRWAAAEALKGTTEPAALARLCQHPGWVVRLTAAEALEGTTDLAALAALVHLCQDPVRGVRWAAADALKGTTDPFAVAALLRLRRDRKADVREAAARALEGTTEPAALAALLRLCWDPESDVRMAAARALEGTMDPAALAALVRLCEDRESDVREAAARALGRTTDPAALVTLVHLCQDPGRGVCEAAARALAGTTDRAALAALVRLSEDPRGGVRVAAAEALRGTTGPAALVRLCEDPERNVRWAAAWGLRGATDRAALAALLRLCWDPDQYVREVAADALRLAPPGSGVAQRILADQERWSQEHSSETQGLLFARLLPDDVAFAEWPRG